MFYGQQSCLYEGMDVCGISLSITLWPQVFPVKKVTLKKKQTKTKKEDTSRIKNDFSMCLKVWKVWKFESSWILKMFESLWILKMFHGQQSCQCEGMDVCGISLSITLSPQVFPVKKGDLKKKTKQNNLRDISRIKNDFSMCLKVFHFFR